MADKLLHEFNTGQIELDQETRDKIDSEVQRIDSARKEKDEPETGEHGQKGYSASKREGGIRNVHINREVTEQIMNKKRKQKSK